MDARKDDGRAQAAQTGLLVPHGRADGIARMDRTDLTVRHEESMKNPSTYVVEMTAEQWGTVTSALNYVVERARDPINPRDLGPIDLYARKLTRRCLRACIAEIESNVPKAEEA
jgi:hypothetical protein